MRAVVFDFDGLILDTESPSYQTFVELYREYGAELPLGEVGSGWSAVRTATSIPMPIWRVRRKKLDREALERRRRQRHLA